MAKTYWPNQDAVGSRIQTGLGETAVDLQVVGIARDSKYKSLSKAPMPFVYLPMPAGPERVNAVMLVATNSSTGDVASSIRSAIGEMDKGMGVDVTTMSQIRARMAAAGLYCFRAMMKKRWL